MKNIGIICEYNPFHSGHQFHIEKSRESLQGGHVICIMSGNFVQRGEPAIVDKWTRAKMAILSGADLVIELPTAYAVQSAEFFALGAVAILEGLNCIDYLSFGSESGDLTLLEKYTSLLYEETDVWKEKLHGYLAQGMSYPKAMALAMDDPYGLSPNHILAVEYMKALRQLNSNIKPFTIKRAGSHYHEENLADTLSSATAIRNYLLKEADLSLLDQNIPPSPLSLLLQAEQEHKLLYLNNFSDLILYKIRSSTPKELKKYITNKEGLEHRIKKFADSAMDATSLIEAVKTKRYSRAFLQRTLLHLLLGMDHSLVRQFKQLNLPSYARILAFNQNGRALLKSIKKTSTIPIITKVADFKPQDPLTKVLFDLDLLSTNIYNLGYPQKDNKIAHNDYKTGPVMVHELGQIE